MNKREKTQFWLELLSDFICLIVSSAVSFIVLNLILHRNYVYSTTKWLQFYVLELVSFVVIYLGFHININIRMRDRMIEFVSVLQNATLTFLLFSALTLLAKNPIVNSRSLIIVPYFMFIVTSALSRYFLKRWLTSSFNGGRNASIVGVLTTKALADEFVEKLNEDWSIRVTGVALLDNFCEEGRFKYDNTLLYDGENSNIATKKKIRFPFSVCDIPVIATDVRFMNWIRSAPLDEVFINLPYRKSEDIQEIVEELESMGITVHINIPTIEGLLESSEYSNIICENRSDYPMVTLSAVKHDSTRLAVKRLMDIATGFVGCILSVPIIAITAIPLLIESPGPLFFKQERIGKNGRVFKMYKLRSMYVDAEERKRELMEHNKMDGLMFKMDNDPRITKVGKIIRKLSIDELPQFFNVLKGDMSLIGTRPPTVAEFEQYESRHKRRLSMRPGITGMWQVSGRSDIQDFEEVVKLDCKYIDEWSIWLDIKIFFKTIKVVLLHEGAE